MSFKLILLIHELKNIPVEKLGDCGKSSLMVEIEWRGSGRKVGFLRRGSKKNCTSKQHMRPDGTVIWNEEFNCICKLKRMNSHGYKSWIVNLQVQESDKNSNGKSTVYGETKIDIAEYASPNHKKTISIPIRCKIKDQTAEIVLKVELHVVELNIKGSMDFARRRALSSRALSCVGLRRNYGTEFSSNRMIHPSLGNSSSEDEHEFSYSGIATANILLGAELPGKLEDHEEEEQNLQTSVKRQPSLVRLLSNKTRLNFKATKHPKGEPLLNKSCSDVGGDDIDLERHQQSSTESALLQREEKPRDRGFEDEGTFEVGVWERRRLSSRDEGMELVADVFLASIDQRSEKAAGESACTVLAVVIADWLHHNPKALPLRCQFDELIHQGSLEWRKLCADEAHKEKFSDQHFDLDTVLEAKVRPLTENKTMSYVGFFGLDDMPDSLQFLQGTMSFDNIWDELLRSSPSEERIYIASWNDHFFVLRIEGDAIYLVDTFGERLFEGCNQAYILKFDSKSMIYKRSVEAGDSDECRQDVRQGGGAYTDGEAVCEGVICCREYIKGFLAALPLRELQQDVNRGVMEEAVLHRHLQIEFHYVAPLIEE
ncbi:unnamed protein product [Musa acuminata var. zebrina]